MHPQLGYEYLAPLGEAIIVKSRGVLGFVVNVLAAVDVRGYLMCVKKGPRPPTGAPRSSAIGSISSAGHDLRDLRDCRIPAVWAPRVR
jgi:hypothetical protein